MRGYIELQVRRENARLVIPDSQDSKTVGPVIGYAQEPLLPLADACRPLVPIIFNILVYVSNALEHTPDNPSDGLTSDESASIYLYTMEWSGGHRSLYSILNETLRTADREQLKPWFNCCSTCQAIHGCFAFTYSPSSQQCWPKTSISSGKSSTGDAITGYNPNICGGFIRKDNWDISGNDLLASPVRQPDYASCCLQCQATYGCIAFTYSPSSQRCSLKTSIDSGGHSTSDTITGYSRK
ncbi:unnamed protein product [Rotaria sordida]|uniref:Apple domain-containing protein n=1 Tax=Rotaria sordida TaxID=392033 RepID=A0A814HLX9_9BILA|nr:unnamed protein product [Rotaria sordida]